jgi:hypothetical protein
MFIQVSNCSEIPLGLLHDGPCFARKRLFELILVVVIKKRKNYSGDFLIASATCIVSCAIVIL